MARLRRVRSIAIVAVTVAAGFIWTAASSQAAASCDPPGGLAAGFEIDGDFAANTCTTPGDDWAAHSLAPTGDVSSTTQGGTYSPSGKDTDDPSGWVSSGSTPDKADFGVAYSFAKVVAGHYWVFVAWERDATSGTGGYVIEIDNSKAHVANDTAHTPQPDRSNGGATFYISTTGGAAPTLSCDGTFSSIATYGVTCPPPSTTGFYGAVSSDTLTDPFSHASVPSAGFYEVAIDVTQFTGIVPSCPGSSAASLYLRSLTGEVKNGNLKGYLAPLTLQPDSTCVTPPITTTADPGNSTIDGIPAVVPGSPQQDDVTVGTQTAPGVGFVDFFLCSPADVTTNGGDCSAGGTQVGGDVTLDSNGQGQSTPAVTDQTTPADSATGKYCWRAEFTPGPTDTHYLPGTHTNSTTECFTVVHASPKIATQIAVTGDNSPGLGFTTLGDTATLSDYAGNTDGQTITFDLFGPYAQGVTPTCDDTQPNEPVFTTTGTLSSGSATTSQTYKPTAAGTYVWVAHYAKDSLNDAADGKCSDANESATIVAAQIDVSKSANPPGPVSAGESIGFDLTVSNNGSVPAINATVTDNLPSGADGVSGGDLDWSLDPAYTGCSITGSVGDQTLSCTFAQVDGSTTLPVIHITSSTSGSDCGVVSNKASVATDNGTGGDSDTAHVTVNCPNLSISKTADAASVSVGSSIGFTITASNAGPGDASGTLVDDVLPTGEGIVWTIDPTPAKTHGPLSCAITSGELKCTGTLDSGASEVVHVTSPTEWTADNNSCGTYDNTATVTSTFGPSDPILSNTASEDVLCPDLSLTKSPDAAAVNAGTSIGFTIVASNTGDGAATGALIDDDPLPAGVTWSIDAAGTSGPLSCGIVSSALTCTGTLGAGETETVHITAPTDGSSCGTYDNNATLTATNTPQAPSDGASTQVLCANVVIQKSSDADSVTVGSDIGFKVSITNNGDGQASGVDVEDPLPAGQGVVWSIDDTMTSGPLDCSITGSAPTQTLSCTGTLAATGDQSGNDVETVHITSSTVWNADLNSCGTYDNTATVTWDFGPEVPISSNLASEDVLCPNLTVAKTPDAATVSAGQLIGFHVEVTQTGPGVADGVTLDDPLPPGTDVNWTLDSVTGTTDGTTAVDPSACSITGAVGSQDLQCDFGNLETGADIVIHVVSTTTQNSCAIYDNTASLMLTNGPNPEQASASTEVQCPSLTLTKTADAASVDAGKPIGFTITVANAGPGTAFAVALSDPLPTGKGVAWSIDAAGTTATGCSVDNGTLNCALGDLPSGASVVVHLVSDTGPVSCATYHNVASLTAANAPDLTAQADTTVKNCAGVQPTSSSVPPPPLPNTGAGPIGSELEWSILLTAAGVILLALGLRRRRGRHA